MIADGKRGDIGSTARAYADGVPRGRRSRVADALTVNPWLGRDVRRALPRPPCGAAAPASSCLVQTSNAGGDMQDVMLTDGRPMWHHVASLVDEWGEEIVGDVGLSSVGAVVGATHPQRGRARRAG